MRFGLCCGLDVAPAAAAAGFDYIEMAVGGLLMPQADDATFEAALAALRAAPLPCPVVNCFVPGDIKITGPSADPMRWASMCLSPATGPGEQASTPSSSVPAGCAIFPTVSTAPRRGSSSSHSARWPA